ncbi:endoglucanase [Proteiniborus ethanoligenes]|uniref:Endoglucanase n=1 Tax=Proteiniborus ethanoligenes TaxID=415015 RepID=A0A1H3NA08_9FIRM|nr:M42 family metallopeptidase [Proteiniborus ethanoligenes]TAH63620.1 MAG: M42 family peptidase [Gottschalkiaceae bacterium]SDY85781.1 endoglucanase [Proteiniborus ethanoligenes]
MLLKKLTEACGVSGNEKEVRELIINEIKDYVDDIQVDRIGNIIAYKKGTMDSPKIMIAAHMDEVGLMVTKIEESGLIRFTNVGGIDQRVLVSKPVLVGKKKINGVIGAKPFHLQKRSEWKKALGYKELYVDIGVNNKEEAEKLVSIGDYISFASNYVEFGDNLVKAKALDDRVGCSILIDLLKTERKLSIYGVFTVMEEIGLVGAGPAAYRIGPDIGIVLEGTTCSDVPEIEGHLQATELGKGPAISIMDRTTIFNREFRSFIIDIAQKNNIPFQLRKTSFGGNDSGKIHLTKEGSITATISVPCRYIHSPISVMNKEDFNNASKLLGLLIENLEKGGFNNEI